MSKLKVGDVVTLNDEGLVQCFGMSQGLWHMRTLRMKITKVGEESETDDVETFAVEVDNSEINRFMLDDHCFDVVRRS